MNVGVKFVVDNNGVILPLLVINMNNININMNNINRFDFT